jgi:hypothetical protein
MHRGGVAGPCRREGPLQTPCIYACVLVARSLSRIRRARAISFLVISMLAMLGVAVIELAALPLTIMFDPTRYWYQR